MRSDRWPHSKTSRPACGVDPRSPTCARSRSLKPPRMLKSKGFTSDSDPSLMDHLKDLIREVPDFPKPGINFYDITTLLKDPSGLRAVIDGLCQRFAGEAVQRVVGIEARGFIFAPAVAYALSAGFVPIRKPKKLPSVTERLEYALEYGSDVIEMHRDAIEPGQSVLI